MLIYCFDYTGLYHDGLAYLQIGHGPMFKFVVTRPHYHHGLYFMEKNKFRPHPSRKQPMSIVRFDAMSASVRKTDRRANRRTELL